MRNVHCSANLVCGSTADRRAVLRTLRRFGRGAIEFAERAAVRIVALRDGERYRDRSPSLVRLGIDVDGWPAPPAGLFVVEERTVYLRSMSPMTVAHEFGHALDCALGGGVYLSGVDPRIKRAFAQARRFVTPYAASGLDEYFAEALRAYVEVNDPASPWPAATRKRLQAVDSPMYEFVAEIFATHFDEARARAT
jgi:hypothetical protein